MDVMAGAPAAILDSLGWPWGGSKLLIKETGMKTLEEDMLIFCELSLSQNLEQLIWHVCLDY